MELELCIFDLALPTNTLAVLRRMESILRENGTNSMLLLSGEALARIQALVLILWGQVKFQSYKVAEEWMRVRDELKPNRIADTLKR